MDLRPARPDEYDRLTAVWKSAVEATHDFIAPEEIASFEARLPGEFLPSVDLTVAADDSGEAIGFIGIDGPNIEMLFVDPAAHRRGVGRSLVDQVAAASSEPLSVDVNEENPGAVAFYERLGFERYGRSDLDQDGMPHPLIRLRLGA